MARDLLIIEVSGPATMGAESFSNRGDIASSPHDLFVFNFFSSDLVNSSDTDWNLNCGIPCSRPLRLLQGTVCLLVCPSDLKRRSTTPVKILFKALAICFLSEVGLPSMLRVTWMAVQPIQTNG